MTYDNVTEVFHINKVCEWPLLQQMEVCFNVLKICYCTKEFTLPCTYNWSLFVTSNNSNRPKGSSSSTTVVGRFLIFMGKPGIKTSTFIICDSCSRHLLSHVLLTGTGQAETGSHREIQNTSVIAKKVGL